MEPLDERYFRWLCSQVVNVKLKNPSRTYWSLLKQLHTKEFVWIIPNDEFFVGYHFNAPSLNTYAGRR